MDWDDLVMRASAATVHAYAPYSGYVVGAAAICDNGRVITGCNIENASYGLSLCAECALVAQLHLTGGGRLVKIVCVDGLGGVIPPCGRCRQILWEHGGATLEVLTATGERRLSELLPEAWDASDLKSGRV
ncbi:MAG: cytidine deaminase [Bifidobacteriaceae bacterium]|nr:cytidine deaminase [Bifidobacteriaceae bacterium]